MSRVLYFVCVLLVVATIGLSCTGPIDRFEATVTGIDIRWDSPKASRHISSAIATISFDNGRIIDFYLGYLLDYKAEHGIEMQKGKRYRVATLSSPLWAFWRLDSLEEVRPAPEKR